MEIWIFQTGEPLHIDGPYARPMRAMNLANELVGCGHKVKIFSTRFNHTNKKHREGVDNVLHINDKLEIILVNSPGYKSNISITRILDHALLAINLRNCLLGQSSKPDVAFVGYPPIEFAFVALKWLKKNNVPVMLDVKDKWPDIFTDKLPLIFRPISKVILMPYYYMAKYLMRTTTSLCTISQSYLKWMLEFSERNITGLDIVSPLTNCSVPASETCIQEASKWWITNGVVDNLSMRIIFIGSITNAFDFQPVIDCAMLALKKNMDWQFIICGDGENRLPLVEKCRDFPNVIFPGWIDSLKIVAIAKISKIALAPYRITDDFLMSIPNKIYDYLSLGLPVLTSLNGETGSLIKENKVGFIYNANSPSTLFEVIEIIYNNPEMLSETAARSHQLYYSRFDGKKTYNLLANNLVKLNKSNLNLT